MKDWEATAVGPCPDGSCVYLGDIGDNDAARSQITVYRVPEPSDEENVTVTDAFHATFPDGPHDAETLLISQEGRLHVVTKGELGETGLYRFPSELTPGRTHLLELVGKPRSSHESRQHEPITDGTVSPDGAWVVLRTTRRLAFFPAPDFFAGRWPPASEVSLERAREPQGEGVAIAADGTVYLIGEGGGGGRPGTFARLTCSFSASANP